MIVPPPQRPKSHDDSILPLINIVFLLIIFFMLAGVMAQNPPFPLTPPSTEQTHNKTTLNNKVLSISQTGELSLAGRHIERSDLKDALAGWPQHKPLQIRADGRIKTQDLTGLFTALRNAGIGEINLLTRHKGP